MTVTTPEQTLRKVSRETSLQEILSIVREDGGVIIKNFLTPEQIASFNGDIEPAMQALKPGSSAEQEEIAEFHGSNTKRLTGLVARSKTFREDIVDDDLVHSLCDAVFKEESGTYWINSTQVIEIGPGNKAQPLHRDLENWHPFVDMGPKGPEAIVNFLIAFSPFTEENGATRIVPGSHRWDDYYDRGTPEQTIPAEMEAGDCLFFAGKLSHGGGANRTASEYRRAVAFSLCPGFLTGEEAYPFIIDKETVKTLPERVQRLVGFRSQYPKGSPGLWMNDYNELGDYLGL